MPFLLAPSPPSCIPRCLSHYTNFACFSSSVHLMHFNIALHYNASSSACRPGCFRCWPRGEIKSGQDKSSPRRERKARAVVATKPPQHPWRKHLFPGAFRRCFVVCIPTKIQGCSVVVLTAGRYCTGRSSSGTSIFLFVKRGWRIPFHKSERFCINATYGALQQALELTPRTPFS